MEACGIDELRQTDWCLSRQSSLGTNKMPRESCLHSAANADGCSYQRQRIVGLLRNACEAGTMLRRRDTAVSVSSVSLHTLDNICVQAKGCCNHCMFPLLFKSQDIYLSHA